MRRFIASVIAALSVAAVPALALADSAAPHDCTNECDCAPKADSSATTTSQEPSDFVRSIWSSP